MFRIGDIVRVKESETAYAGSVGPIVDYMRDGPLAIARVSVDGVNTEWIAESRLEHVPISMDVWVRIDATESPTYLDPAFQNEVGLVEEVSARSAGLRMAGHANPLWFGKHLLKAIRPPIGDPLPIDIPYSKKWPRTRAEFLAEDPFT